MPYGQLVYNLIDYSNNGNIISSFEQKLSQVDNLTQGAVWTRIAIQAPPYSRWLIKQRNDNVLNKIIRVGKSGVFEFDKDIEIQQLSYIPTYENVLNKELTKNEKMASISNFNVLEGEREDYSSNELFKQQVTISYEITSEESVEKINPAELWQFIKDNHSKAPDILQFNKEINTAILKTKLPKDTKYPWSSNTKDFSFKFYLSNGELQDIFNNEENRIKKFYDGYIENNINFQQNFIEYYVQYLKSSRGIYLEPDELVEIEPYNIIIDYYYEEREEN